MTVRVRLAPSPTGNLHIGTARTGVFNWLFARHHGGQFILRIEDTDLERSRPEFTENILEGLKWLGLNWDEGPFFQSDRMALYQTAIQKLLNQGLAYRCYVSTEELEALRATQMARKEAPRYDNRHRHLTPEQEAAFVAEGRPAVIRFKIDDDREIVWHDLVRGKMTWRGGDLGGDMVIARTASATTIGQPLYNFVVVVDDIDMQISHVIRGEDHIANTAKQILLYEALGAPVPQFAHTPLILDQKGQKLSKRRGVTSISDFRKMGYLPEALANYMTLLGWSSPDATRELFTLAEAATLFDFDRVNAAGAKFDWVKLDWVNSQYLHRMAIADLTNCLIPAWQAAGFTLDIEGDRVWLEDLTALLQTNLVRLPVLDRPWLAELYTQLKGILPQVPDAVDLSRLFFVETLNLTDEAKAQLQQPGSAAVLQSILEQLTATIEPTEAEVQRLIQNTVEHLKVKKALVMRSLRASLMGDLHGPDMAQSFLLLYRHQQVIPRLKAALPLAAA